VAHHATRQSIPTIAMRDVVVPALEINAALFDTRPMPGRVRLEQRIVAALYAHLAANGWRPIAVCDGEELTLTPDVKSAMELIFNLDAAVISFRKGVGERWISLVMGNGAYIMSDYSCSDADGWSAVVDAFDPEAYA